ncbi:TPA: hypothetical protein KNG82_002186 [Escherichia coli]|nr:hypothetical protein [Escherichia coli]
MKTVINKMNEIGNQALFANNAEQVDKAADEFRKMIKGVTGDVLDAEFTEEEQNIIGDALVKVRLAVGANYLIDCLEKMGFVKKARDIGLDSDELFYTVEKETERFVNGELVHVDGISFTITPAMVAFFLYNMFTDSAAEIIAATGEQIDIRRKVWQMVSVMVFEDATGPAFTEEAIKLIKEYLESMAERLHDANGDVNQMKHTVH